MNYEYHESSRKSQYIYYPLASIGSSYRILNSIEPLFVHRIDYSTEAVKSKSISRPEFLGLGYSRVMHYDSPPNQDPGLGVIGNELIAHKLSLRFALGRIFKAEPVVCQKVANDYLYLYARYQRLG